LSEQSKKPTARKPFDLQVFLISKLRAAFKRAPGYSQALNAAKSEYQVQAKNGNMMRRVHFKCASCGKFYLKQDVAVDHIEPISTFISWDIFIKRLFCTQDNLQVLCSYPKKRASEHGGVLSCHTVKTRKETEARALERLLKDR
jgi:5-methylcytosine-specific restriction endonuclease McrA